MAGVGSTLTWSKRMKIALHAAKGLAFLHGAERPIIYRDFKTSNVLLDAVRLVSTNTNNHCTVYLLDVLDIEYLNYLIVSAVVFITPK